MRGCYARTALCFQCSTRVCTHAGVCPGRVVRRGDDQGAMCQWCALAEMPGRGVLWVSSLCLSTTTAGHDSDTQEQTRSSPSRDGWVWRHGQSAVVCRAAASLTPGHSGTEAGKRCTSETFMSPQPCGLMLCAGCWVRCAVCWYADGRASARWQASCHGGAVGVGVSCEARRQRE